jgi:hypothetical protein
MRYSTASSIGTLFLEKIKSVEVVQSGFVTLYYMLDAQLFVQPRLVPHR